MRPLSESTRRVLRHPPLLALETEYSVTFIGAHGDPLDREACSGGAVQTLAAGCVHLPGRDPFDLSLENGGRFDRDAAIGLCNLEYATPECTSPAELIAHIRAGDALVEEAVRGFMAGAHEVARTVLSKTILDYRGTTSGSHENYLGACQPQYMAGHLTPLLASRVYVSRGGGFDDASPGIDFLHVEDLERFVTLRDELFELDLSDPFNCTLPAELTLAPGRARREEWLGGNKRPASRVTASRCEP